MKVGIHGLGAYVPRLRLDRGAIYAAMGFYAPAAIVAGQGTRAVGGWDEDAITMAVAAAREALAGVDRRDVTAVTLASTTLPFADRQNAGIAAEALDLSDHVQALDATGAQKAGLAALVLALDAAQAGRVTLVAAAERREARSGSFHEMLVGDGAGAAVVGPGDGILRYEGSYAISRDLVDHYRVTGEKFDTWWEERFARDEGYGVFLPEVVGGLLKQLGIAATDVAALAYPCPFGGEHARIAKVLGVPAARVIGNLHEPVGDAGNAHAFLQLAKALETLKPGERVVVAAFGQGAIAASFVRTSVPLPATPGAGLTGALAHGRVLDNYARFLQIRGNLPIEVGYRGEAPLVTALSTLWRERETLTGLKGVRCGGCGAVNYPPGPICVSCGARGPFERVYLADTPATVVSSTSDVLAFSPDPPSMYGMVDFAGGGRMLADFTDGDIGDFAPGAPVRLVFRRRSVDPTHGLPAYFWKAVPARDRTPVAGERRRVGVAPEPAAQTIRFDGRVVVITGAGGALGTAYAEAFAERGAALVVNDVGTGKDGRGTPTSDAAERTAARVRERGAEVLADGHDIADAAGARALIDAALARFGRIDVLIHNAGILRDRTIGKTEPADWAAVLGVHLDATFYLAQAAFAPMKAAGYGRVIFTTSGAGLYGNFGQTQYAAAKTGVVGLAAALKQEGAKFDFRVNTIAPIAASRLTEGILPEHIMQRVNPAFVVPLVLLLASDRAPANGGVYGAIGGLYQRVAVSAAAGAHLDEVPGPEAVAAAWSTIDDALTGAAFPDNATAAIGRIFTDVGG